MKKSQYNLTPQKRQCFGIKIIQTEGLIKGSENILSSNDTTCRFTYPENGMKPSILIDLGPSSPGGYPIFNVKTFKGEPVIRIAYSDCYQSINDKKFGHLGDFKRGTCKYLGVELPVLPANPNRFELYSITHSGFYTYPLIQGQQRFIMIILETEKSEIELSYFYIHYTSDISKTDGHFDCNDERLTRLWYSSTYTAQLCSFTSNAWDSVNSWLFPRALSKGKLAGLIKFAKMPADYTFAFTVRISLNPDVVSGFAAMVRAADTDNGYIIRLDLDSNLYILKRHKGYNQLLKPEKQLNMQLKDNRDYKIGITVKGADIQTYLDGKLIDTTTDNSFLNGSVGFCPLPEKLFMITNLKLIDDDGHLLFTDNFNHGLKNYQFTKTPPFVADGAKRDRLPWIGDLDWTGRNIYYAFRNTKYMKGSLELFALHQTDEGYVHAVCYPENRLRPHNRSYGNYASDIFSAWFVPTIADYYLFTGDTATMKKLYPTVKKDLDYLWQYVESDGLFYQRYETSKGLWDHHLGDYGKFSYNNIIIYDACREGAFIANNMELTGDAAEFNRRANRMNTGIMEHLYDYDNGYLKKGSENSNFCYMSNCMALAVGFFTKEQAKKALDKIIQSPVGYGKVLSTGIRGAYQYGFEKEAFDLLTSHHKMENDWGYEGGIGWLSMFEDWRVPHTTTECMYYPQTYSGKGANWGDMSHPDSGMAHILTGLILGVQPLKPGFQVFEICPHVEGLTHVAGDIPIPGRGMITVELYNSPDSIHAVIDVPVYLSGSGVLKLPLKGNGNLYINGIQTSGTILDGRMTVMIFENKNVYEVK